LEELPEREMDHQKKSSDDGLIQHRGLGGLEETGEASPFMQGGGPGSPVAGREIISCRGQLYLLLIHNARIQKGNGKRGKKTGEFARNNFTKEGKYHAWGDLQGAVKDEEVGEKRGPLKRPIKSFYKTSAKVALKDLRGKGRTT